MGELEKALKTNPIIGQIGIAHTRWATHGKPSVQNAHPHICRNKVVLVHNGIIENFESLKRQQQAEDYVFTSDTDTEVIVHLYEEYGIETPFPVFFMKWMKSRERQVIRSVREWGYVKDISLEESLIHYLKGESAESAEGLPPTTPPPPPPV